MKHDPQILRSKVQSRRGWWLFLAAVVLTIAMYYPGLSGGFLFDDYPNIVDNKSVQLPDASMSSLVGAALSSPASEFKRPLASLSFAANYLISGTDPYWMKLTNLIIHLLNGLLVFLLANALLRIPPVGAASAATCWGESSTSPASIPTDSVAADAAPTRNSDSVANRGGMIAALIAGCWMLLPINLTGVLYVVQRMESLANLFVLAGLVCYVRGRQRMLAENPGSNGLVGLAICVVAVTIPTLLGLLAKETAVMLPLYAFLIEWIAFGFAKASGKRKDLRVAALFAPVLLLPMLVGLTWLLPQVASPSYWSTRDFTLYTRLLSEARIVADYIVWILLPTPGALSFYHDNFHLSQGLLRPWTTLVGLAALALLTAGVFAFRRRQPLVSLGIALFLACHLLTGTILPLELIYEHRNYFASFGLLLALVPLLAVGRDRFMSLPRRVLLGGLLVFWTGLTAITAYAWGNPLRLADDLAARAPDSPRAQYELGRTYIIYSHYDPASPFTRLAYAPLEQAMKLPGASILPEQALIFMNARMHLPIKDAWWDSMIAKLKAHKPGVQDESSLGALTQCARDHRCDLSRQWMMDAFLAALSHAPPSARLLASYSDYAWNVLEDHELGMRMARAAVAAAPQEPAYRITEIRMLSALGETQAARAQYHQLQGMNIGGSLDESLRGLSPLVKE